MEPTLKNVIIAILALLGGGFGTRLIDFVRARWEKNFKAKEAKDAEGIKADLTVNDRLMARIDKLESRMDTERDAHVKELQRVNNEHEREIERINAEHGREIEAYSNRVSEVERKNVELDRKNDECELRYTRLEQENRVREQNEKDLTQAKSLLLYSYDNIRSDLTSLRRHVERVEDENRRLKDDIEAHRAGR